MSSPFFPTRRPAELRRESRQPVDAETLVAAAKIVDDVRQRGQVALREHGERLGDLQPGAPLVIERPALEAALAALAADERMVLLRTAGRVEEFARAQREAFAGLDTEIPGGRAGHTLVPVQAAGCYAPGGRYPLPSSVLMGAVPARVAGVETVWVASPRPAAVTLAAAAAAGADALLAVGGAQAVAALAYGADPVPRVDVVVGPGNRWVTAAKQLVSGAVGIDMLAGPSELVVLADRHADPGLVAADLLAQAEHDDEALPILVSPAIDLIEAVRAELETQLETLPTAPTASNALANGYAVLVADLAEGCQVCDRLAPEHLQLSLRDPERWASQLNHAGALFLGEGSAEVLGDYGAGPNHTLPTGESARFTAGLSVFTFLRPRTWLSLDPLDPEGAQTTRDAVVLARLEGLEAHARAAERRLRG